MAMILFLFEHRHGANVASLLLARMVQGNWENSLPSVGQRT